MRANQEIALSVGTLLLVLVLVGFGSVGLLARMGPAIGVILRENDASLAATETMLATLAEPSPEHADRQRFRQALAFADANITLPAEREPLDRLHRFADAALTGDAPARREAAHALRDLAAVNRANMAAADAHARRLGAAGAWAAVLLSLLGVGAGILMVRRLYRRLVAPLDELRDALHAAAHGDRLRRCRVTDAPVEFIEVRNALNAMFEASCDAALGAQAPLGVDERAALLGLLDALPGPAWVVGEAGRVLAANAAGLDAASAGLDVAELARQAIHGAVEGLRQERLHPERPVWLLRTAATA
jgi:nitrogen fixation/metabolism regulation signal transduction histidine kinase